MAHKFSPGSMSKLDDPRRIELLPAREILLESGLGSGQTFLDVGAGTGYFTFPASEIVGETGKVIAVDIADGMIRELRERTLAKSVRNIEIKKSEEYDVGIGQRVVDMALMCAVLHEIDDKERFLSMLEKVLAPGGRLAVIEWEKKVMEIGPPLNERLEPGETARLLTMIGMEVAEERKYNGIFYGVTGVRSYNRRSDDNHV